MIEIPGQPIIMGHCLPGWFEGLLQPKSRSNYCELLPECGETEDGDLGIGCRGFEWTWQEQQPCTNGHLGDYLESQWPIMMGCFLSMMGYFMVEWPGVLGYLTFQVD